MELSWRMLHMVLELSYALHVVHRVDPEHALHMVHRVDPAHRVSLWAQSSTMPLMWPMVSGEFNIP